MTNPCRQSMAERERERERRYATRCSSATSAIALKLSPRRIRTEARPLSAGFRDPGVCRARVSGKVERYHEIRRANRDFLQARPFERGVNRPGRSPGQSVRRDRDTVRKEGPMDIYFHILFSIFSTTLPPFFLSFFYGRNSVTWWKLLFSKTKKIDKCFVGPTKSQKNSTSPKKSEKSPYFYLTFQEVAKYVEQCLDFFTFINHS